ncbi:MAG: protein kinase [Pyrinomonadaceae bacterium]
MKQEDWQKIKEAFNRAVEMPESDREEFLAGAFNGQVELRSEVEEMLAAVDDEDDTLEDGAFNVLTGGGDHAPTQIGDYRIIREIGRGGMGAVYEALRETRDFRQKVALKIIKRGMDSDVILSRFHHERQILASLRHPNIAGFIDGGMTEDGRPFYAMEHVEGVEIDRYCFDNDLSVEERLELFRQVCAAVQHAHQNFVAHRDIKPNNILITPEKSVKLLDFGIAKVLSADGADQTGTVTEFRMMTPAYASPEQVRGEKVGVQSDIYSLGVVLYELLTGRKPFDFAGLRPDEAVRMICEEEPPRPSATANSKKSGRYRFESDDSDAQKSDKSRTADQNQRTNSKSKIQNPKLKGDLDNIILKALKKEPERRYASVQEFSEDIRRHLTGLPVGARPDTFFYRTSKFIKRHKVSVVAASLVLLALVAGLLATLYQARVAQAERLRAEKRFEQVRKLANNVVFKYHDAIAALPGSTAAREMLVKDAIEYLDNLAEDAGDNPELQNELAQAYLKIGNVQGSVYTANLGDSDGALKSYEKSITFFEDLLKKAPDSVQYRKNYLETVDQETLLLVRLNRWPEAEKAGEKLLEGSEKLAGLEPGNPEFQIRRVRAFQTMGDVVNFSSGHQASIEWYRRALEAVEKLSAEHPEDETVRRNMAVPLQRIGTKSEYYAEILKEKGGSAEEIEKLYLEAAEMHRRSLEIAEGLKKDFPEKSIYNRYVWAIGINYGTALARIGRGEDGIPLITGACRDFREASANDPKNNEVKRDISECFQYLAFAHDAMGEPGKAIEANRESLKILEDITVKDPENFEFLSQAHLTFNNTGDIFFREGKFDDALDFYRRGMAYVEKMSKLNESPQIRLLRSDSNRKIGKVLLVIAEKNRNRETLDLARKYLIKAQNELREMEQKNDLGRNNEYKLALIARELERLAGMERFASSSWVGGRDGWPKRLPSNRTG